MGVVGIIARLTARIDQALGLRQPLPLNSSIMEIQRWAQTPSGRAILSEQQAQLDLLLQSLFGYHLLELSSLSQDLMSSNSPINHRFRLSPVAQKGVGALCEPEQLPLDGDSIDVVLLHHMLEFSSNPHQVLREANRVLIARGYLIIIGFNPFSLQGFYRSLAQWLSSNPFWRRHTLRPGRVMDWLHLLDCEPVSLQRGFYRPPLNHEKALSMLNFWETMCRFLKLPFGGYYILMACKQRLSVTPIKPVWGRFNPMAGLALGDPPRARVPQVAGQHNLHKVSQKKTSGE